MRKTYIGIAVVALVVLAVVLLIIRSRGGKEGEGTRSGKASAGAGQGEGEDTTGKAGSADRPELAARRKEAQIYPPTSRPIHADDTAILDPNRPKDVIKPTGSPKDRRGSGKKPAFSYILIADKHAVTGEDPIVFTLRVFEGKAPDSRVPANIKSSSMTALRTATPTAGTLDSATFADDGQADDAKAGDLVYTATVVPGKANYAQSGGSYALAVEFEAPEGKSTLAKQYFMYTPEDAIPARFTGKLEDRVSDGSLVISAEVEVRTPGRYTIQANLFDAEEVPVAYATFRGDLNTGTHRVDLLFFGKVLRDKNLPGPYLLRNLRGYRTETDRSRPGRQEMADHRREYRTQGYSLDTFSDAEWKGGDSGGDGSWQPPPP